MNNIGVFTDENGWGAIFSILCVSGIRAEKTWTMKGLNDSKKLSPSKREELSVKLHIEIDKGNIVWYLAERTAAQIDSMSPYPCLKDAYAEVFQSLHIPDCQMIADGSIKFDNPKLSEYTIRSEPKADGKYPAVMAASILGKTYRDKKMIELDSLYPFYGIKSNKGYPNPQHLSAIKQFGICDLHRRSYEPIKSIVASQKQTLFNNKQINLFGDNK